MSATEHLDNICFELPAAGTATIAGALAGPLVPAGHVDISCNFPVAFEPGDWLQLSSPTCLAVLRIRRVADRPADEPAKIFLPYTTRTAIGQPRSAAVTIARLPSAHAARDNGFRRAAGSALRPLLRSPRITARISEALVGDDSAGVVGIDEGLFPILGIDAGDEVILRAGRRAARAIAVPPTDAMVERMAVQRAGLTGQRCGRRVDLYG